MPGEAGTSARVYVKAHNYIFLSKAMEPTKICFFEIYIKYIFLSFEI